MRVAARAAARARDADDAATSRGASRAPRATAFAARGDVVVVGFDDGSLARFDAAPRRDGARDGDRARATWTSIPRDARARADDARDGGGGAVDACCVGTAAAAGRVARCRGDPTCAVDVLDGATGDVVKTLTMPTAWPATGRCAVGGCGTAGEYAWARAATKWNHSGDEFAGNGSCLAIWRLRGDEATACAVFTANADRRSARGGMEEEKTLAPFARVRALDGGEGLEYVTIAINFDEEYAVLERKACAFTLDERGRTRVRAIEATSLRVDLGWMPRFGAVRGRALELAARAMPTVPSCAISSQFIVVVWLDGERPVHVIDSRAEGSTDSRRGLLEALRVNVEACLANPDAKTSRTVLDVTTYDGDAYVIVVTRDAPMPQKYAPTPREEDIHCKVFAIPTGFRSAKPSETTTETTPLIDLDDELVTRDESCTICLDVLSGEAARAPCCGASFCEDCLASYVALSAAKGCPMCRDVDVFLTSRRPHSAWGRALTSFELDLPFRARQQLKKYRVLEQVLDGDYATLDDFHLTGDRTPFALENGRALTLATSSDSNFEGVEVRELVID